MMRLSEQLIGTAPLSEVYNVSIEIVSELVGADRAAVLLLDQHDRMRFEAHRGLTSAYRAAVEGHSPWAVDDPDPRVILVADAAREPSLSSLSDPIVEARIGTIAFIPLIAGGRLIGKFMLYHERIDAFDRQALDVAEVLARHVAAGIERIRQQRALSAQYAVSRALAEGSDDAAIASVLRELIDLLGWPFGDVWWVEREGATLRCVTTYASEPGLERFADAARTTTFPAGEGLPGRVLAAGGPVWLRDVTDDPNFSRAEIAKATGIVTGFGFPIMSDGRVTGVIECFSTEDRSFDRDLMALMEQVGRQIGERMRRREAERSLTAGDALRSALFDAALDAVLTMDEEGKLADLNRNAEQMFGISRDDIGRRIAELVIPPELRQAHEDGLRRYLDTGHGPVLGQRIELEGMAADGRRFPVELTVTRVSAPGSSAFTAFIRDISDRRRREDALSFLAQVGPELNRSLDPERTLETVAQLAVPRLADWSAAYVVEPDRGIRRLSLRHADPRFADVAAEIESAPALDPHANVGVPRVIATGEAIFEPAASPEMLAADAPNRDRQVEVVRSIGVRSWICVPVRARGVVVGAASFLATGSRTFGPHDLAVFSQLAERAGLALENALLYRDRDTTAKVLQQRLLPPALPEVEGLDMAARYLPAGEAELVGGDFYDVFDSGANSWSVLVGDVCGKGVSAAAVTSVVRNAVRAAAMHDPVPSDALTTVNEILLHDPVEFVTACLVRLRRMPDGFRLDLCCAGHPLPYVVRADGTVEQVGSYGTFIGAFEEPLLELHDERTILHPGDALVLSTDGIQEHRRADGAFFGDERIMSTLEAHRSSSAADLLDALTDAIRAFEPSPPRDDVALFAVRVTSMAGSPRS